ncbi:hypothetical protein KR222_008393, partial [Zaprionus bogoriensis]
DMSASHALTTDDRLPKDVIPLKYEVYLEPKVEECTFSGFIKMNLRWKADSKKIWFHSHFDMNIDDKKIRLTGVNDNVNELQSKILRGSRLPRKTVYIVYLKEVIKQGTECILEIPFEGNIWGSAEGLFTGSYNNFSYFVTNLKPNNARRLFPCFDEPEFKVPFNVSIARPNQFITIFNTPIARTIEHSTLSDYVVDYFEVTPPLSAFTFGFVTTNLKKVNGEGNTSSEIAIWTLPDRVNHLETVCEKVSRIYKIIQDYFGLAVPLKKIDVVVIPELPILQPVDNWGLLLFKENDLVKNIYYDLAQELIYQWLGSWVTPEWWSEAHLNKALARFIASEIVTIVNGGVDLSEKYPMTTLYSLYYELSKRYPHSRITGMKQETVSYKTELIIRMLNFTLGKETFQKGIRNFLADHQYKTFIGEDLWESLALQAHKDGTLNAQYKVANIANTWLQNNRLPVVNIRRNYADKTAIITQNVYLRERPHDAPEKDKMLWWIPIILNCQNTLNFANSTPYLWMEKVKQIEIKNLPESNQFIIINQEEIAPFPVNYDEQNWNLLGSFLLTEVGRKMIPAYTRSKLLHDAWNLAYAGDLSFATAFNMTLFMKFERNHIVWNPVFTFIDQIGRHIDASEAHKKFEAYVLYLLAPLYEDLGTKADAEANWKSDLRSMTKRFLCSVGYRPCITEAQNAFTLWKQAGETNPDTQLPNEYMCPTYKWGSLEEWQFGLQRVMQFPKTRPQSERTHQLKTLASCPTQPEKINLLLKLSLLDEHSNFTENDKFLILTSLTRQSSGYYSLFNFLSENWMQIRQKLKNNTNLWDHLIGSATGFFLTQKGYDLVKDLYEKRSGEFESAQHIIEKSIRNIKEEAQWSEENLPVIEAWLDAFLS